MQQHNEATKSTLTEYERGCDDTFKQMVRLAVRNECENDQTERMLEVFVTFTEDYVDDVFEFDHDDDSEYNTDHNYTKVQYDYKYSDDRHTLYIGRGQPKAMELFMWFKDAVLVEKYSHVTVCDQYEDEGVEPDHKKN